MDLDTLEVKDEGGRKYKPLIKLEIGEKRTIKGAAKDPYIQKRRQDGFYSCTCPSWRNLSKPERERSCGHLKTLLGEEYEQVRTRMAKSNTSAPTTIKRKSSSTFNRTYKKSSSEPFVGKKVDAAAEAPDPDVFPHSQNGHLSTIRVNEYFGIFNERDNGGPRGLNGAAPLLLAHKWPETKNPEGYWLSEKLDGVRAWWNGEKMYARSGRGWNPPKWFKDKLPKDLHLDGELWIKRDAFDHTSGICRRSDSDGWKAINMMVFDVTNVPLVYEERLKLLKERLPDGEKTPDQVQDGRLGGLVCVLPAVKCMGKVHFESLMKQVLAKGGEGLMIREPRSFYEAGRSKTLYKYKSWYDAEGLVIGHEWGQGEHKGRMGAIKVLMESGHTLRVGSGFSHAQRNAWQPAKGAIIRYRFQELSHDGFPRFPIYEGTCPDKDKPKDAIVRSEKFRADARADELKRFFEEVDANNRSNNDSLTEEEIDGPSSLSQPARTG